MSIFITLPWRTTPPTESDLDEFNMLMIPQLLPSFFGSPGTAIYISQYKEGTQWRPTKEARKRIQTVQPPTEFMKMCASCRYWQKRAKPGGDCRRNSPQAELVRVDLLDIERVSVWPGTDDADWCGEWEACQ